MDKQMMLAIIEEYSEKEDVLDIEDLAAFISDKLNSGTQYKEQVAEILIYFNEKTGKNFRHSVDTAVGKLIVARLREGHPVSDFKQIIGNKVKDPYFMEHPLYMRPRTLFAITHFEDYREEGKVYGKRHDWR